MHTIAERIICKLGGHQIVADLLRLDISRVYRWTYPKSRGGTDGKIPTKHQQTLMNKAVELGLNIKPQDFFDLTPTNKIRKPN